MKTEKIDNIVKEFLLARELTLHYYVPSLLNALVCLRELSFDINLGKNIKELELVPNQYNRITIPADCVEVIGVFGMVGGERRLFRYNENISLLTDNVAYKAGDTTLPDYIENNGSAMLSMTGTYEIPTQYAISPVDKYCYNVDKTRDQIVLGVEHGLSKVYLRYETSYVDLTSANLVHPYVIPVVSAYLDYVFEKGQGSMNRLVDNRQFFYNQKRLLKSRLNPMTIVDYYKLIEE